MQEQKINFETAKLAKEKGFKSKSIYYNASGDLVETPTVTGNDYIHTNNDFQSFRYEAPTQSLLQKWLRDKHKLYIDIQTVNFGFDVLVHKKEMMIFKDVIVNSYNVSKIRENEYDYYNTYEEALEMGLQEALKLI